jgi:hypothetical protein
MGIYNTTRWDEIADRFIIMETDNGFMPFDTDCDEYLCDEKGNNCFDKYSAACELVDDAIKTIIDHEEDEYDSYGINTRNTFNTL